MSPSPNDPDEKPEPERSRGGAEPSQPNAAEFDDREVAGYLAYHALIEIRALAGRARRQPERADTDKALEQIRFLADLTHNLPMMPLAGRKKPSRNGHISRRERAMRARPMSWTWNTAGDEGRQWMLGHITKIGAWTPPPPLPTPVKNATSWDLRQRLQVLASWPVRTPSGRQPLPRQARILKALTRDQIYDLYEEAGDRRLGLGAAVPRFRAHLDPDAQHYIFPDPPEFYWPDEHRLWWGCRVFLRMVDGEQVKGMVAVLPETFTALPSTLPRWRQRRLALATRMLERDYSLWYRDHEKDCSPQQCGYHAP